MTTILKVEAGELPDAVGLAWAAGLADGEACFRYTDGCTPSATIRTTHLPTTLRFARWFGGSVLEELPKRNPDHRPTFVWQLRGARVHGFLRAVLPYLWEKGPQAELLLSEPIRPPGGASLPRETRERRRRLVEELSALKRIRYRPEEYR